MIVKVPIYVELIGKVGPEFLSEIVDQLGEDFYLKLRKRKLSKIKIESPEVECTFTQEDLGINDIRILDKEEALDSLRVKR